MEGSGDTFSFEGRVLTLMERGLMQPVLGHYSLDVDGPIWMIPPMDVRDCLRFTERPDLDDSTLSS